MAVELWQQEAKKLGGESLVEVIQEIRDGQVAMLNRLDDMDKRHTASEEAIASVKKAFPNEDIDGHRRYHDLMVERNDTLKRLTYAIKEKTVLGLIFAVAAFLGMAVLHEAQKLLKGV